MAQSLSKILIHLVFSTKDRQDIIAPEVASALHAYVAGSCTALGCPAVRVGGTANHVHVAYRLSRIINVSDLVEGIKKSSSKWMKREGGTRDFAWQVGYGAFSVSASHAGALVRYIDGQAEHHRVRSFEDELIDLLRKAGVEYDARYLWT